MTATVWIHQARPRTSWYALDEGRRAELRSAWAALDQEVIAQGAERVGAYTIRGQSDFSALEVWRFAGPEAVYDFWAKRVQADYAVWFAFSNQVGVKEPEAAS
jgi:hypothetical protein